MKGWTVTVLLVLLLNAASAFAQADRHDVRQGNRYFEKGDFGEAELAYRKGLVKDSLSTAARYNLASSLYRQENYDGAKEIMGSFDGQEVSSDIHYNTGDIALQLKDYASAVEAFRQSLLQNPGDLDAKENYIYAKKMLENQQNRQNGGQDEQKNQDDNESQDDQNQSGQQPQPQPGQDDGDGGDDGSGNEASISPQQAQQMLNAVQAREEQTRDKVDREKAAALKSRQKEKNW